MGAVTVRHKLLHLRRASTAVASWRWRGMKILVARSIGQPVTVFIMGATIAGTLTGCSGDTVGAAPLGTSGRAYFSLQLNEHAINMSLDPSSNTIQLAATPLNGENASIPVTGQINFRALDSTVTVSPTGLVTANYVSSGTSVVATLSQGGVRHADTAFIRVTATPPAAAIQTFSIQPVAGDSAVGAWNTQYTPTVSATDAMGDAMIFDAQQTGAGNVVWLSTSNQVIASISRPLQSSFQLVDTGHVTLYATSWVYGISVRDSLKFLVGWPLQTGFFAANDLTTYNNGSWTSKAGPFFLGVGGVLDVGDYNSSSDPGLGDPIDIIFDDSTKVDSAMDVFGNFSGRGNIHFPPQPGGGFAINARSFPIAGTYHFHNRLFPELVSTLYVLPNPSR